MTTPQLCSTDWDDSGLPAWGTAKDADVIVAVESAGAWGHDAVGDSGLPTPDGAVLYLIREPERHATTPTQPFVAVAGGFGERPWLMTGRIPAPQVPEFLSSDITSATVWDRFGLTSDAGGLLLVCTNGRRDVCCAVRGRPVLSAACAAAPGRAWEVSHIGGHRFAPTAIHLPSGQTFGRLTPDDGVALAQAGRAGDLPGHLFDADHHRGRVDLTTAQRVAETSWRHETQTFSLAPIPAVVSVETAADTSANVGAESGARHVRLPDGRTLAVTTHEGPELRDSCAKLPKKSRHFQAHLVE